MVRIFMDGGGGFLKIIVNVFEQSEVNSLSGADDNFLDSWVQFLGMLRKTMKILKY